MAHRKRQYGSGSLFKEGGGWAIRWRELEIAPDGTIRKRKCYEALGNISRREAAEILRGKVAASDGKRPLRSRVTFRILADQWKRDVLPTKYKHSTQKNHRHILEKHLLPGFGDLALCEVATGVIQTYVTHLIHVGYAPKSIDHIHDVLSAVLRSGVKWGHLTANPAHGVEMPRLRTVRPKWALTVDQAIALFEHLPWVKPRTMVGLALLGGVRRGELFAFRWRDFDVANRCLYVREAVYEGTFDEPKTDASMRLIPLPDIGMELLRTWQSRSRQSAPQDLIFSTVSWQIDLTEQRAAYVGLAGLQSSRSAESDVADVPSNVFLMGTSEGRAPEGGCGDHGPHEGGYDPQRLHASARRRRT
jgi:integrase